MQEKKGGIRDRDTLVMGKGDRRETGNIRTAQQAVGNQQDTMALWMAGEMG